MDILYARSNAVFHYGNRIRRGDGNYCQVYRLRKRDEGGIYFQPEYIFCVGIYRVYGALVAGFLEVFYKDRPLPASLGLFRSADNSDSPGVISSLQAL